MIREIGLKEALERHHDGKSCLVWIDGEDGISVATFESVLEKFRFVVDEEPTGRVNQKPAKKNTPAGGRKKVDTGKIRALRNAEWPIAKIADEMGISVQTVYSHLKKTEQETQNDE